MIRNLIASGADQHRESDVLVVGAGIAGLVTAHRLRKHGLRVLILESGDVHQAEEQHELNATELGGDFYTGGNGRYRCLGGTSTRWGGAMLPFLPIDMEEHSAGWDAPWPLRFADVAPYQAQVEALFNLPSSPIDRPDLYAGEDFIPRFAKWPAFAKRNVAKLFRDQLRRDSGLEIWLNATVTACLLGPDGRAVTISATAPDGSRLVARAPRFILAAGAIENTRLLLLIDRAHDDRIFAPHGVLGRHLHDHLSAHGARLECQDSVALGEMAGFRFESGGMRNLRFELSEQTRRREGLPGGYAQITFASPARSAFEALRDIYRAAQRGHSPAASDLLLVVRQAPWSLKATWTRLVRRRLLVPQSAVFGINLVVEQRPDRDNRISLSAQARDRHGLPLPRIDWRVHDEDMSNYRRLFVLFRRYWAQAGLGRLAAFHETRDEEVREQIVLGGGTYHPGGTTRMGRSAAEGVLDSMMRVHQIPNISAISTAAFPSGGAANPTFTMMMFALRAADQMAAEIARA